MVKKKKKFKRWFKIVIYLIFVSLAIFILHLLNQNRIINLDKYTNPVENFVRNLFTKNNSKVSEKVEEDTKLDDFSTFFKERLSSQGLTYSTSSIVDENGNMKIFLLGTKNNSGYLYVNTGDNPQYVWITLVSALSAEPLKSKIKTDLEDLDYIDLRFSNKVFYKFGSTNINLTNTQSPTENQTKENSENSTSTSDINASTSNPFVKPIDHN